MDVVEQLNSSDILFPNYSDEAYILCFNNSNKFSTNTFYSIFCSNDSHSYPIHGDTEVSNFKNSLVEFGRIVGIVVPLIFGVVFIIGLIGNALVMTVVATNKQMRDPTNLLIFNLALADLLFIIVCVPFTATDYVMSTWPFGYFWCKTFQYLIAVNVYESIATLILMSGIRFLAILFPLKSIPLRTGRNTLRAIGITWIIVLIGNVPPFIFCGIKIEEYAYEGAEVCRFLRGRDHRKFQLIFMLTSYALPLIIITIFYIAILCRLRRHGPNSSASEVVQRQKKRHVTRMIIVVIFAFAVCWLPIQIVLVLKSLDLYEINDVTVSVQIAAHVLGYVNSCLNPILYAFLSENFREGYKKLIRCPSKNSREIKLEHRSRSVDTTGSTQSGNSTILTI